MSKYQLAVGARVEFPVKFDLQDGAKPRKFGMRLSADRHTESEQRAEFDAQILTPDYLAGRNVKLESWIGDAPLKDGEGVDAPPSQEALEELYAQAPGLPQLVLSRYVEANGVKGRSGN